MKHNKIHIVITNRIWYWYRIFTDNWIQFKKDVNYHAVIPFLTLEWMLLTILYTSVILKKTNKQTNKVCLNSNLFLSLFNFQFFPYLLVFYCLCVTILCVCVFHIICGFSDFTIHNLNTSKRSICEMCQSLFFFQKQLISLNWWFIQSLSLILLNQICAEIVVAVFFGGFKFFLNNFSDVLIIQMHKYLEIGFHK